MAVRSAAVLAASVALSLGVGIASPPASAATARPAAFVGKTIPFWTGTVTASQNGKQYRYQMVGRDPRVRQAHPSTRIVANIIPIVVKLANGQTFDPTRKSCGETSSPLDAVLASPIFKNTAFRPGGTDVGTTQFGDAFQRANFWTYTNPSGVNPGYHVLLQPRVGKTITINVPTGSGRVVSRNSCEGAGVTMAFAVAQGLKLLPGLAAKEWGVNPTTFPIFLLHNVDFDKTLGVPGAVGFHTAFSPSEPDIAGLSHEIAEWLDDPLGTNPTPPWGDSGQVNGHCQANLEVGDPLTRTTFAVTREGVTYHPQEQAFFSWFYGPSPSIAVNGMFSFNGTLTRPAPICPPGGA